MKRSTRSNSKTKDVEVSEEVEVNKKQTGKASKTKDKKNADKVEQKVLAKFEEVPENDEPSTSKPKAGAKPGKNTKKTESPVKGSKRKVAETKPKIEKSDNEEEEEEPPVKQTKKKAANQKTAKVEDKPTAKQTKKKNAAKKPANDEEEEPPKYNEESEVYQKEPSEDEKEVKSPAKKKGSKKTAAVKKQSSAESDKEEVEKKPAKSSNKRKATASKEDEGEDSGVQDQKKSKAKADKKDAPKTLANNTKTNYENMQSISNIDYNLKIASWNVAGLRALVKKNPDYIQFENPDILCLNEIKCTEEEIPDEYKPEGYNAYWNAAEKGQDGVGILSKQKALNIIYDIPDSKFDNEKRMITAEFEKFYLVAVYVVNAGRGLKTLEKRLEFNDAFDEFVQSLDKKKPVIIAGDMNVSHQEIDLKNPKGNKKNAGFTQEERDGFTKLLSYGFVDTFRHFYPIKEDAYTFWTYMMNCRAKNVGWRLDYYLVSQRFMKNVKDNIIRSEVLGSDHCPIVLLLSV